MSSNPGTSTRLQLMFPVSRAVAFGISEDAYDGGLPVAVVAGKHEHWQRLPFKVIQGDVDDLVVYRA